MANGSWHMANTIPPLQGLSPPRYSLHQGDALGYDLPPLRG
jgi:hypothetical protein